MLILSHRGMWEAPREKNTISAFRNAFLHGFGVETDLRDSRGTLVIAHDPPSGEELPAVEFLALYAELGHGLPLALNIKADGLQVMLRDLLNRFAVPASDYFVFDMSVPEAILYLRMGFPTLTRLSDVEREMFFLQQASGVWVDGFSEDWTDLQALEAALADGKRVCFVSPELHGRGHQSFWARLATWRLASRREVMLCTDLPVHASRFFATIDAAAKAKS